MFYKKHNAHFSILMRAFNATTATKNISETATGDFGTGTRNRRGQLEIVRQEQN